MIQVHARRATQSVFRCSFCVEVVIRERLSKICLVHFCNYANVIKNQINNILPLFSIACYQHPLPNSADFISKFIVIHEMIGEGFISNAQKFLREIVGKDFEVSEIKMLTI